MRRSVAREMAREAAQADWYWRQGGLASSSSPAKEAIGALQKRSECTRGPLDALFLRRTNLCLPNGPGAGPRGLGGSSVGAQRKRTA
jgi:hypothetical protein